MVWLMKSNHRGSSVLEIVLAIVFVGLIVTAILSLLNSGAKLVYAAKTRLTAVTLANEQIEFIRNLPYNEVGTSGGIPTGSLAQTQTRSLDNLNYTVETDVIYVDDSYDYLAPTDLLNIDYKKATVTVSWKTGAELSAISLTTTIAPNGIETNTTGGTLYIEVYDPSTIPSTPLANATVTITAPTTTPAVSITKKTNSDGIFILAGAPPGIEAYHVVVSKPGYHSAQTYATDPVNNPNPNPADLNVITGEITTQYFEIAPVATSLTIHATDYTTGVPINTSFDIHGETTIGNNGSGEPIYKYNKTIQTNNNGDYQETNFETDTFHITLPVTSSYVLAGNDVSLPYTALPNSNTTINLQLATATPPTALFTITNAGGEILPNANVHIATMNLSDDRTLITNTAGQVFFTDLAIATIYQITVTLDGYQSYTTTNTFTQHTYETIALAI